MIIQYQTNIPLPKSRSMDGKPPKYPWREMPVGASFFVAVPMRGIAGSKASAEKRTGRKFTMRTVTEDGVKGTRVWRTE